MVMFKINFIQKNQLKMYGAMFEGENYRVFYGVIKYSYCGTIMYKINLCRTAHVKIIEVVQS